MSTRSELLRLAADIEKVAWMPPEAYQSGPGKQFVDKVMRHVQTSATEIQGAMVSVRSSTLDNAQKNTVNGALRTARDAILDAEEALQAAIGRE
jgi:uncharacterized cysteine cluster protein YcgN (CxxCxxCC family)